MFDYYVTMVEDCVAGYEAALHKATLENIRRHCPAPVPETIARTSDWLAVFSISGM